MSGDPASRQHVLGNFQDYYGIRNGHEEDPRLPWLKELVDWRGARVLDLGCNSGVLTMQLAALGCRKVLGVDIDPSLVCQAEAAQAAADTAHGRLRFVCRDMMKLRLRKTYDVILLLSTSKWVHLQNGDQGLKELFTQIRYWLRPNGIFILEPQPWKAYKKVADASEEAEATWRTIRLRPSQFLEFLTQELKFHPEHRWVHVSHALESFQRTMYFIWTPKAKTAKKLSKPRHWAL